MSMKKGFGFTFVILSIAGCAWQSEALKLGDDTYQVSANASPARGGITGAREMAVNNANKKCDSLGKKITVTDIKSEYAFPVNGVATVTFTCK
jgi:stage III sporulation protein SpoIIIAA